MFAILLTLAIAAEPPKFTVVPGFVVTAAPVKVKITAGKVTQEVAVPAIVEVTIPVNPKSKRITSSHPNHSHLCPRCGLEWWHGDNAFGHVESHRCPDCGFGPVWKVNQRLR
jgi:predicted RNA-binding Zn-ribbon protein involved in translation (DUF1610 family)